MTSLFRPGFLYDRGISRILQQTSPVRWCSRTLSCALSLSLALFLHRALQSVWKLAVRGVWHLRGISTQKTNKQVHLFCGDSCHIHRSCLYTSVILRLLRREPVLQQSCPRFCRTERGKWADTERTTMSVRCPSAAGCRTPTPSSERRRGKDLQNSDRSAERREVRMLSRLKIIYWS